VLWPANRPCAAAPDAGVGVKEQKIGSERQARPLLRAQGDGASRRPQSATQGAPSDASLPPVLSPAHIGEGSGRQNARLPENPSSPLRRCAWEKSTRCKLCLGMPGLTEGLAAIVEIARALFSRIYSTPSMWPNHWLGALEF